ncbi:hypothetical protein Q0590_23100 [Rhodocytophaga aerolata]|uniref:Nephrocystin 3-like N-terminal domain-containing protein n=1 Tax=Rhodocytophaga aerolata TaxID=455078 RepID=A0ABT8RD72_9BACT|nr:hypothetical protein [Rhodocytophaga aerolata]MDO1449183.1 hypothetical protein [Rhodocytophaga aerolata]
MANDLVAYSRAGDIFHYRWAARRCLRLVYPNSSLNKIIIEGSSETEKAGEYVIDVTEYAEKAGYQKIDYYQLKHTTVQQDEAFTLSDLKDTFEGFAKRFLQHQQKNPSEIANISFTIITNRKIADSFKENLSAIVQQNKADATFTKTIEKYTSLTSEDLRLFCAATKLEDSEGDYNVQKNELRSELSQLIAGSIDNAQINNLVALVQEKVLPDSDGSINREEVLKRFGISSEGQLYPAPAILEEISNIVEREQHNTLKEKIINSSYPVIVHAAGGVGKSVFCRQLVNSLPEGSVGIVYDCFGAGKYRNPSEPRHGHRHALVQIANELATKGLCDPLLVQDTSLDENIIRNFLLRVATAVGSLKKIVESAQLFIVIDAADNAEMAARELNHRCFAHELIREQMPEACKLVFLCRTERISLLQPQSFILKLELDSFSEQETLQNLWKRFPNAMEQDGAEFHRLTGGNPRVQANALDVKHDSVNELLSSLGPFGTSIEKQIELQLNRAVSKIKDLLPNEFQDHINAICLGLASLPPHIPIDVLSRAADVSVENVRSFVADIGRSLWLSDTSIQFRDEPTETWFRNTFLASKSDYEKYIVKLEPLANTLSYVAEVLPQLYLQAEHYRKLIDIALSDEYLPENNPIDARNIRVYRLQFAFKAALKARNYKDAIKLAMRAGEEVAGNQRQLSLLQNNIDLLTSLQSKEKVQEIAFKRLLSSTWNGSENVYAASLLSGIKEYHGEARGYLRAGLNWLHIYFDEARKNKDTNRDDGVNDSDILELAYTHLNLHGVKDSVGFLLTLKPKEAIFRIVQDLTRRLIDFGRFKDIYEFLQTSRSEVYFTVAVTSELIRIGRFPEKSLAEACLELLCHSRSRILKPNDSHRDQITPAIVSFVEACLSLNLSTQKVLRVLRHYIPIRASRMVYNSHFSSERTIYLKALAIRSLLLGKEEVDLEEILPKEFTAEKKNYELESEITEFKEIVGGLFPWFLLRTKILYIKDIKLIEAAYQINEKSVIARTSRYRRYDTLPSEITEICASIIILYNQASTEDVRIFYEKYLQNDNAFKVHSRLNMLRAVYRTDHLTSIIQQLEPSTFQLIKSLRDDGPEEIANRYISLARAVLITSAEDASVYFDEAINIASKFGDELVYRWEAIVSLAKQSCNSKAAPNELAYRFIRCAELVGDNVYREKHWNRSEAMRVCTKMSSGIGISALSRWRDRDIGRFEYQFEEALYELVNSKVITSAVGWALTRFFSNHRLNRYLSICLENELSHNVRQKILNDAVHLLQIQGTDPRYWKKLNSVANRFNLNNESLNVIIKFYADQKNTLEEEQGSTLSNSSTTQYSEKDWDDIFNGLTITNPESFVKLIERFEATLNNHIYGRPIQSLLKECLDRLTLESFWDFINMLLTSETIDRYDVQYVLSSIPKEWTNKVSFKKKWPGIVYRFGERYAHDLTDEYSFDSFIKEVNADEYLVSKLKLGIFSGLANGYEFANANIFFGFVDHASSFIEVQDACDLVEFSLSRFELHTEADFGDGVWSNWLDVPEDINKNIAGFIWSALGSPKSAERWNAAHCIRKLADLNCTDILDSLIGWLEYDKVDAFGSKEFPFYNLHARLYLLIALSRTSLDQPELVKKYSSVFAKYALTEPHILIQKFASNVALNIERVFPLTYDSGILIAIEGVGKSKMPIQEADFDFSTDSYWHKKGEVDTDINFHFGWDFDRYWYKPLGDVFGVSGEQIQDLAANIIVKEWRLKYRDGYNKDPRNILWNRSSQDRETWHDHSSYPRTDDLDFYLSYHSMLVVAARLIEKMPVISKRDWYDDEWSEWLSRHLLTREDGKWLADCRDPLPLKRPEWIFNRVDGNDNWKMAITDLDFLTCLNDQEKKDAWITVKGGWHEKQGERSESFHISSALVSKGASNALLRALATCSDPHDYKLPDYDEDGMEIDSGIFSLKGWINKRSGSEGIDEFDPYANQVEYPPYSVGSSIKEILGLTLNSEGKCWSINGSQEVSLICETWNSSRKTKDEEPAQSGMRLKASLKFLKHICKALNCELIFKVSIKREIIYKYREGKREYEEPQYRIFILSEDGKLRTTHESYQLR